MFVSILNVFPFFTTVFVGSHRETLRSNKKLTPSRNIKGPVATPRSKTQKTDAEDDVDSPVEAMELGDGSFVGDTDVQQVNNKSLSRTKKTPVKFSKKQKQFG